MGEKGLKCLESLWQCFLSLVKIVLQSRRSTPLPSDFGGADELLILANGPSLKKTVEESAEFMRGKTLLAVNFCVTSPMFEQLRPQLYLIADPLFWIVPEKREQLFGTLAEKTTWDMYFFVPSRALKNKGNRFWPAIPTLNSAFTIPRPSRASSLSVTGYSVRDGAYLVRTMC